MNMQACTPVSLLAKIKGLEAGILIISAVCSGEVPMTITQLEYILTAAHLGSINMAAQKLFVAQPHLSKSIHAAEQELGFQIFQRVPKGVIPTEKGQEFLRHCSVIVDNYHSACMLAKSQSFHSVRIATANLYIFVQAFRMLCEDYQNSERLELQFSNGSTEHIAQLVYLGKCSLGGLLIPESGSKVFEDDMRSKSMIFEKIGAIPLVITVRKNHPAISDGKLDISALHSYAFVDYADHEISGSLKSDKISQLINPKKMIRVDEREIRHQIVSSTNAYSIGCELPDELLEKYDLMSTRLSEFPSFYIYTLYRSDVQLSEETLKYIHYLKMNCA